MKHATQLLGALLAVSCWFTGDASAQKARDTTGWKLSVSSPQNASLSGHDAFGNQTTSAWCSTQDKSRGFHIRFLLGGMPGASFDSKLGELDVSLSSDDFNQTVKGYSDGEHIYLLAASIPQVWSALAYGKAVRTRAQGGIISTIGWIKPEIVSQFLEACGQTTLLSGQQQTQPISRPADSNSQQTPNNGQWVDGDIIQPSFDCTLELNKTERAICSDSKLADMDNEMVDLYFRLKDKGIPDFIQSQKIWLKKRNRCGRDLTCLERTYGNRIADFRSFEGHKSQNEQPSSDYLNTVEYVCSNQRQFVVKYQTINDNSFITLILGEGTEVTLPSVISGSGVRYANENLEWHTKGNSGILSFDNKQLSCTALN